MISTEPNAKNELQNRTRSRNDSVWTPLLAGTALAEDETLFDQLYQNEVEAYLAVTDEVFEVKEYQRDQTNLHAQNEVAQDELLADEKAATERTKLALKIAADNVLHAARVYGAQVRAIIMAAREYAALVERGQLAADAEKMELAADREVIRGQEVQTKIVLEGIHRAMVQVEIAKERLEVAKAGVRVLTADLGAAEAELRAIEAQVKVAMATADAATLEAEVAMTFAEAVTKQLSAITLAVESAGIGITSGIIAQRLADMLALWGVKIDTESGRVATQQGILTAILNLAQAEVAGAGVVVTDAQSAVAVATAEAAAAKAATGAEGALLIQDTDGHLAVSQAESTKTISLAQARAAQQILVNAAHAAVYAHKTSIQSHLAHEYLWIQKS